MAAPKLTTPIPAQVINERASYGPLDLKAFITTEDDSPLHFQAELAASGEGLPKGLICMQDGMLTGIPAKGTEGSYDIRITAQNDAGKVEATLTLTIKPALTTAINNTDYLDQLKTQIWQAVDQKLPIPDLASIYERPVTVFEVYYVLERWATLSIWNAIDLDSPGEKVLLTLEGASPHYYVYDRGSCIVATPKDLFSHARTLQDALQTARAMAREVYKRDWIVEFSGFEKMERAAWVEIQHLEDQHGKKLEVLHYDPTLKELRIYTQEAKEHALLRAEK